MSLTCPDDEGLRAFAIGALSTEQLTSLADHLGNCQECRNRLEQLDDHADQFVSELANASQQSVAIDFRVPHEILANAKAAIRSVGVTSSSMNLDPGRRYARKLAEGPCQLGRFELLGELGDGSFGYVFRARDPDLDRIVALKIQRAGILADEEDIRRFFREAQSAAQLQHPGIVSLYECGQTEDDVCFLVTEFVDGDTLESRLREGRLHADDTAQLIANLADALQYAHEHDVIHRDIKPSNIILDKEGRPHITDFGLAKRMAIDQTITSDGRVMGTPAYMSPEQACGESHRVDARSDVFSLGVVLYELLTEERPFQGNRRLLMQQVISDDPRPPRKLDDQIPKDLETICLKATAKSPNRRYQSAKEMADDLQRQMDGESIHARPLGYGESVWRWCRRNPIPASLLTAVIVGSTVGFWHLSRLSTYFVQQTALDSARNEAIMLEGIRDHYSEKIIDPIGPELRGRLPLPAPYLIAAGEHISQGNSGMKVDLYGKHPWRPRPERDAFQRTALALLDDRAKHGQSDLTYHEFPTDAGRKWLRYAKGQLMKESCVKCHNETKESPKRDWKVGDLVGVLEVTRPLDHEIERTRRGLRGAFLLMSATGAVLAGLSLGLVMATRRRSRRPN